ncbi:S8 family serine peptidase [Paenibacillus sp. JJ-223]|uniref:S8 family serine peptidase n=1 Tax=Paenibacillus sp. JJ-223 TaxID=2905647 RepID=UPI001F395BFE|nr:S8 family serine peptidase [Paenibacillus sp. JJ-223]CAH1201109.1 hypothetical protein PAECIP111890_01774 [Paenibacillus sp. JJ-223]
MSKRLLSAFLSALLMSTAILPAAGAAPADPAVSLEAPGAAEFKQWKEILEQREERLGAEPYLDQSLEGLGGQTTKVIVELSDKPVAVAQGEATLSGRSFTSSMETNAVARVEQQQQTFVHNLTKNNISHEVVENYEYALNGIALEVKGNQLGQLIRMPGVVSVYPDTEISLAPENEEVNPYMKDSAPFIGAPEVWELGYTGEGVKVGVIDTGIDYEHPNLKDAYKGGWDFVDNDDDPYETTHEEWKGSGQPEFNENGSAYYTSHGTHVAGTIAAREAGDFGVKGVAPEAEIYAYRVLGPYGSGQTSWVLGGIDRSVEDNMDIINLSLGNKSNDPSYVTSVALNNAMLAGVTSVVASGNDGPNRYTLGSPGASAMAITVGNSTGPSQTIAADAHFWIGTEGKGQLPEEQPVPDAEQTPELGLVPEVNDEDVSAQGMPENGAISDDSSLSAPKEEPAVSEEAAEHTEPEQGADADGESGLEERVANEERPVSVPSAPAEEDSNSTPAVEAGLPALDAAAADSSSVTESVYHLDLMGWNLAEDPEAVLNGKYELVYTGLGKPTDFEGKEINGKIALIQRGELAFVEKIANAKAAGAVAVIVFNNIPGPIGVSLGDDFEFIPALSMSKEDGEAIKAQLDAGLKVEVSFSDFVKDMAPGDEVYSSSSRGPAKVTLDIKPDVVAPGTSILSTIPAYGKDEPGADYTQAYGRKTGTSMATPHVAGLTALLIEKHPDWTPFDIKAALMNNTKILDTASYDVFDQGAGRVQAVEAFDPEAFVKVMDVTKYTVSGEEIEKENITGSINFGNFLSTDEKTASKTIKVQALKGEGGDYAVSVNPTRTVNGVSVSVDKASFTLNGEEEVQVTITVPKGVTTVGEAQGYLQFSHGTKTYSVPYVAHFNLTQSGVKYIETKYGNETNPFHYPLKADGTLDTLNVAMEFHNPMNFALIEIFNGLDPEGGPYQDGYIGYIFGNYYNFNANTRYNLAWTGNYLDYATEAAMDIPDGLYTVDITSIGTDGKTYVEDTPPFLVKKTAPVVTAPEKLEFEHDETVVVDGSVKDLYFQVAPALQSGWNIEFDPAGSLDAAYVVKKEDGSVYAEGKLDVQNDGTFSLPLEGIEAGEYVVEFSVKDQQGLVGTARTALSLKFTEPEPETPATRAPGTPVLSHNNGHANGLLGGSYTVSMNMWWGENATSYKLYEDGVLIDTQKLTYNAPMAQFAQTKITGKTNGTYTYVAELTNDKGTTRSQTLTVRVTDASPGKAVLSHDNWDGDGNYKITMNLWWGTNATEYRLYENDQLIDTQALGAATPSAQRAVSELSGRASGTYTYRAELINEAGVTSTDKITVKVK